jgi:hypothetical protein
MIIITIEVKYHVMKQKDGKLKKARLCWRGPGIEIYVLGSLSGHLYNQAENLAMNYAQSIHIPAGSLRRVF